MKMTLSGDFCDFCNVRGKHPWTYKVKRFEMATIISDEGIEKHISGDWGACNICHDLIENNKWDDLINRVLDKQNIQHGPIRKEMFITIAELYETFRQHRVGTVTKDYGSRADEEKF